MGTENITQYMGGGWILVADEKEADFYVAKGDYIKKGILDPATGTTTWYVKKKKSTPKPTKPPKPTTQPQPTKPPTNTPSTTFDPPKYNLHALNNAQRLERDGLVVDCEDTFDFPIKKDGKFCRSKKIGDLNKCFFNHDLKNIAGEDLIIYLKDLGFTIEDGVDEFSYNEILKTCSINENKSVLRKIIKENTIKILSEYLNK